MEEETINREKNTSKKLKRVTNQGRSKITKVIPIASAK